MRESFSDGAGVVSCCVYSMHSTALLSGYDDAGKLYLMSGAMAPRWR